MRLAADPAPPAPPPPLLCFDLLPPTTEEDDEALPKPPELNRWSRAAHALLGGRDSPVKARQNSE